LTLQLLLFRTTRSPSDEPICTIAAHTQLDEIAAIILSQLLRRQDVQACPELAKRDREATFAAAPSPSITMY
jgi:hypothetical protein